MDIEIGSLRCMAPSLAIPPHRHYDPSDLEDSALRLDWAKLLFRAGYRLRYPQETTGTAVLLFHRILIQAQVGKHRRRRDVILTTCLFLAGKVTEAPRRLRDVINVLYMLTCTGEDEPPLLDKRYWTMKERIVEFEQVLLRTINFQVDPPDPYRLLLNYARSLRLGRAATRSAWALLNDCLFCPRALSAPPPAVACAAIRMACRVHGGDRKLRWLSPPLKKRKRAVDGGGGGGGDLSDDWRQEEAGARGDGGPVLVADGGHGGVRVGSSQEGAAGLREMMPTNLSSSADGDRAGAAVGASARGAGAVAVNAAAAAAADVSGVVGDDEPEKATAPWWRLFDARDEEVELVCSELAALYRAHATSSSVNGVDGDAMGGERLAVSKTGKAEEEGVAVVRRDVTQQQLLLGELKPRVLRRYPRTWLSEKKQKAHDEKRKGVALVGGLMLSVSRALFF